MRTMRRLSFTTLNRSDNLLHIETNLGIVNIRVGLHDAQGRMVESVELIPDESDGVVIDGYRNNRFIDWPGAVVGQKFSSHDAAALDYIATLLDGHEWTPSDLDSIAEAVRGTGRVIRDPAEV